MGTFADAIRALKAWKSGGAGAKGYADMIRAIKVFKTSQPKPFKKGGSVKAKTAAPKGRKR